MALKIGDRAKVIGNNERTGHYLDDGAVVTVISLPKEGKHGKTEFPVIEVKCGCGMTQSVEPEHLEKMEG